MDRIFMRKSLIGMMVLVILLLIKCMLKDLCFPVFIFAIDMNLINVTISLKILN